MCGSSSWTRITDFHSVHTGSNPVPHANKIIKRLSINVIIFVLWHDICNIINILWGSADGSIQGS